MKGIKPNLSKIARQYSCDPRTVKRYLIAGPSACIRAVREYHSILEAYEPTILEKLEFGASAKAIHIFLRSKGFKGGYSTVKNFCRKHKLANKQQATIRFETNPGLQAQVDWKESLRLQNNKGVIFEVNIFLVVLGYSRYKFIKLTTDRTQPTVLKGLLECFQYFGGVPKEILFDNMRTIVDRSRTQFGKPIYNERLYEFSKDSGFIPKSCLAYKPQTKGKVESLANLMNRLKVYNNEFETLDDLNQIVKQVNEDINNEISQATAKSPSELFKSEQKYLNPLPKCKSALAAGYAQFRGKLMGTAAVHYGRKRKFFKEIRTCHPRGRTALPYVRRGKSERHFQLYSAGQGKRALRAGNLFFGNVDRAQQIFPCAQGARHARKDA